MVALMVGLILFLGTHSLFIFANNWSQQQKAKLGELPWKGLFSVASIIGFGLIVWGYGQARMEPLVLWYSPVWLRHPASLLLLIAFILLVATYIPGTHIKQKFGHPMLLATKTWAFAHLLVNGSLADCLLFGSFLVWAIIGYIVSRKRDRAQALVRPAVGISRDIMAVVVGVVAFGAFAFYLHLKLIGVAPFAV